MRRTLFPMLLTVVAVALAACDRPTGGVAAPPPGADDPVVVPQITSTDEENNVEIFKRASPAAVYITTKQLVRDPLSLNVFELPQGTGSGFIWDERGYVVTNAHVVEAASGFLVTLHDQSSYEAEVVGVAPDKDLAVLKIDAPPEKLYPLPRGDSDDLEVGRKVLAIGNPFGLDATLTTGIISALGREITSPSGRRIRGVIQTDAAINPGNSGGPLLDSTGRLIGVNTAIIGPSGGSVGISFAIPVNTVRMFVPELIEHGRIIRPVLGVMLVDDRVARNVGVEGVIVMDVQPGSGAAEAGLQGLRRAPDGSLVVGDVIVRVGETRIRDSDDLLGAMEQHEPGEVVTVETVRRGERHTFEVRLSAPE